MKKKMDSKTLEFLQNNVLSITDLTRTNKLSEILNDFSVKESNEVYVIQNHKNKDAAGVFLDLEYYKKLLKYEELFEQSVDDYMYQTALERKDDKADIPLHEVLGDEDIDYEYILNNLDHIELED